MSDFAEGVAKLMDSGISVSVNPTAGLGLSLDAQGKVPFSALPFNAVVFGKTGTSFVASNDAGTITLSNVFGLRDRTSSGGLFYTPKATFTSSSSVGGHPTIASVDSVSSGGATFSIKTSDGASVSGSVTIYYLMIA